MPDIPPTSDSYNYSIFNGQGDFEGFPNVLRVGTSAPDFTAVLLETGQSVRLSDYWRQQDLVVEFGSFT
mgnify:CR=1 FL=1|jgi:hypothetical protein